LFITITYANLANIYLLEMPIVLYGDIGSPPCQAVILTAAALGVELDLKYLNLGSGEHLKPEFVEINQQHTIPTIVDGKDVVWESRVIQKYLVEKYGGPDNALYPKDLSKRLLVDRLSYFDLGTLFRNYHDYFYRQYFFDESGDPQKEIKFKDALNLIETFLGNQKFLTGDHYTIADISIFTTLDFVEMLGKYSFEKYSKINTYLERLRECLPTYKENRGAVAVASQQIIQNVKVPIQKRGY